MATPLRAPARAHSLASTRHRADTALYIARLSGELADLARKARLDMVAYCLEMAQMEAHGEAFDPDYARNTDPSAVA